VTRRPLRVAAVQAESASGDLAANVTAAAARYTEAALAGAQLVVLPELFLTGYDPSGWAASGTICLDDPRLAPLVDAARPGCLLLASAALRSARDAATIAVLAVDAGGARQAYDKQHLDAAEVAFFSPGREAAVVTVQGWRVGLGVCYDGCFPEHARAAAASGAQVYACPAAYRVGSEHRRDLYYAARALDNGIYVVLAGLTGRCGEGHYSGGSAVYDPEGRPLVRLGAEPGIAYADLDPDEVTRVQQRHPMLREALREALQEAGP
jgi:predicted amidohydrolase